MKAILDRPFVQGPYKINSNYPQQGAVEPIPTFTGRKNKTSKLILPDEYTTPFGFISLGFLGPLAKDIQENPDGTVPQELWQDTFTLARNLIPAIIRKALFQVLKFSITDMSKLFTEIMMLPAAKNTSDTLEDRIIQFTQTLIEVANQKNPSSVQFVQNNKDDTATVILDKEFSKTQAGQILPFTLSLQGYKIEIQ